MAEPVFLGLSAPFAFAALVLGYLLGSIPFGVVLTRLSGGPDLRTIGSGNIGATNVLRTGNKKLAALTLLGDMLKGTVAVVLARQLLGGEAAALLAGVGAFLGHVFPVWLSFKGGKGVATYLGVLLGLSWPVALVFAAIWLGVARLTRYSSLSALLASLIAPALLLLWQARPAVALAMALLSALLWFMHRENIARLLSGSEGKIGQRAERRVAGILLTDRQRLDWLRLFRCEGIGPRSFLSLINRFGSAAAALDALPDLARGAGRAVRLCPPADAEREFAALMRSGAALIALGEDDYPKPLRAIDSAPPLIAVRGRVEALSRPMVAIVGSRNASALGVTFAGRLARELGEAGFVTVSGLARGIDTAAHEASLTTGTAAVLAGGLDRVYPPQNEGLLQRILADGAALSEMPLGWAPRGRDFPRRNRLVSGLALGTVVVEAARKSGSLITARFANEQGRLVFAVPGSPLDPRAEGANDLIREGATLCASAADVIEALAPLRAREVLPPVFGLLREGARAEGGEPLWDELDLPGVDPAPEAPAAGFAPGETGAPVDSDAGIRLAVLNALGMAPVAVDELVRAVGVPARAVNQILLDLELERAVQRHPGGAVSRAV